MLYFIVNVWNNIFGWLIDWLIDWLIVPTHPFASWLNKTHSSHRESDSFLACSGGIKRDTVLLLVVMRSNRTMWQQPDHVAATGPCGSNRTMWQQPDHVEALVDLS